MEKDTVSQIKLFMEPRSIAFIGIRGESGAGSRNPLKYVLEHGYSGRVYPVNPNYKEIAGIKAYASVKDLPEVPDLAQILTPQHLVPRLIKEAAESGIKALLVVAQGFADSGGDGRRLQEEIVAIAHRSGARVIGPNCFGVANAFLNLNTAFVHTEMEKISIGSITQTGFFFAGFPAMAVAGKVLDLGNTCDIDFADGLEYFGQDDDVRLIVLYVEGIKDGRRFMEVARRVARRKPIIALKAGRSAYGKKSASSHSGSLAGEDHVYDAVFKQCGIIRIEDTEELVDLCRTFLAFPLLKGRNLGVLTLTMAGGTITADACARYGLRLEKFSDDTIKELKGLAQDWLAVGNPVDLGALDFGPKGLKSSFKVGLETVLSDPLVDCVLAILPSTAHQETVMENADAALKLADIHRDKPITLWLYGPEKDSRVKERYESSGRIVNYPSPERAVRALARLAQYSEYVNQVD